jgi:nucleoside-diphosphate-sugar epimerase
MTILTMEDLEESLSRPSARDIAFMKSLQGDIAILGASGKMGPSLARLCRRANDAAGTNRRIVAVSRRPIAEPGVESIACDLLDREQVAKLPDCPNVLYLAGRKFGSTGNPELTWAMNALVPAMVAEHFRNSRVVVFSTGNVYPFRTLATGGARETDMPAPLGEYAQSCLGRERVFQYFANSRGLRCLLFRLNYAVDLRYGVPVDIARKVWLGEPVSLAVPAFNAIWQRDANSYALRSLDLCAVPPPILNVTGAETLEVRDVAGVFAKRFGRDCRFEDCEGESALLSDATRCGEWLGAPDVSSAELLELVAAWVQAGGASLKKPTHFEVADGKF